MDPGGDIYFAAAGFDSLGGQAGTQILHSGNGGQTWDNMSPRVLDRNAMPLSLDPYIWVDDNVDGDTARIFTIDLTLACSYMSFSDDGGESWVTNPLSCGRPVNDHQTLFSGPPVVTPTVGYPNVLYYCWNDVASSACSKSIDGGLTFHPTGSPAFAGAEPGNSDPGFGVEGVCGGLHGHGHVSNTGTVYLPREYCGSPRLAISKDEGRTWTQVTISDKIRSTSQPTGGAGHPSVTTDEKGNVYYLWISAKTRQPYLSVSKDEGETLRTLRSRSASSSAMRRTTRKRPGTRTSRSATMPSPATRPSTRERSTPPVTRSSGRGVAPAAARTSSTSSTSRSGLTGSPTAPSSTAA